MPTRRKYNRNRKKLYRRRNKKGNQVARASIGTGFINARLISDLKYTEQLFTSVGPGVLNIQSFRMNSIFDPDITSVGHQPYGYDVLETIYNRYRVFSLVWQINFAATSQPYVAVVVPVNGTPFSFVTIDAAAEYPRAVQKYVSLGGSTMRIGGRMYLPALLGVKKSEYMDDDRFQATYNSNPAELMTLQILTYNATGATINIPYVVTLIYRTESFDPVVQNQS